MAFILCIISGFSTLLGAIPIFFKFKDTNKIINISLSFAAGVMIMASFLDLIPESFNYLNKNFNIFLSCLLIFIFFIIGLLLSDYINKKMKFTNDNLYKIGFSSMIAILIHNIPEGIITFLVSNIDIKIGIGLSLTILLHNIPEGISIAIPIYYSTNSKLKAFLHTLIAAIAEPFGAILASLFLGKIVNNFIIGISLSIIAGIMINISIYELIPESLNYKNKKISLISFFIGLIFMYLSIKIFIK